MNHSIFISGPSASGKSTVAVALATKANVRLFTLDDYWKSSAPHFVHTPRGRVRTFEHPSLYDGPRLAADVLSHGQPCVVEGFCLFRYKAIQALPASRFYIDVPFDVCLARRLARRPRRASDRSFVQIGQSEMERWVTPQISFQGVTRLNGLHSPEALLDELLVAA